MMRSTQENVGAENVDFEGAVQTDHSLAGRFGLSDSDALIVALGALYVVAFGPFFHSFLWTPRVILLLGALPFGLYELAQLVRRRDRPAIAGTLLIGWALFVGLVSDAPISSIFIVNGRWDSVLWLSAALGMWALGRRLSPRGTGRPRAGVSRSVCCERPRRRAPSDLRHHVRATGSSRPTSVRIRCQPGLLRRDDGRSDRILHRTYIPDHPRVAVSLGTGRCRDRRVPGDVVRITCCARVVCRAHRRRHRDRALGSCPAPDSGGRVWRARCDTAPARRWRHGVVGRRQAHGRWGSGPVHGSGRTAGERSWIGRSPGYGLGRFRPATRALLLAGVRTAGSDRRSDPGVVRRPQRTSSRSRSRSGLWVWCCSPGSFCPQPVGRTGPLLWATSGIAICWMLEPPSHVTYGLAALLLGASQVDVGKTTGRRAPAGCPDRWRLPRVGQRRCCRAGRS